MAQVLASNTNYAAMISGPSYHKTKLKFIQLSKMEERKLLVVVVVEGNIIKNTMIDISDNLTDEELLNLNILLNSSLNGLTIEEINLDVISKLKVDAGAHREVVELVPVSYTHLDVYKRQADGLVLVNDLYLEDYLTKVVPSEMPSSYEKEALKAQAVCARTYAYRQIQGNAYSQFGAHVDDSTNYQVYNNKETDEKTTAAVKDTYGKMLFYEDKAVEAFYFLSLIHIWCRSPASLRRSRA